MEADSVVSRTVRSMGGERLDGCARRTTASLGRGILQRRRRRRPLRSLNPFILPRKTISFAEAWTAGGYATSPIVPIERGESLGLCARHTTASSKRGTLQQQRRRRRQRRRPLPSAVDMDPSPPSEVALQGWRTSTPRRRLVPPNDRRRNHACRLPSLAACCAMGQMAVSSWHPADPHARRVRKRRL